MLNPKSVQTNVSHSVVPVETSARPRKAVYNNQSFQDGFALVSRIVTTNTKLGPSAALLFSRKSVHEPGPTIDEPKHIQVTRFCHQNGHQGHDTVLSILQIGLRSVDSFVSPARPSRSSKSTNTTSRSSPLTDPRQHYLYFLTETTSPPTTSQAVSKQDDEVHKTATARNKRRLITEECSTGSPQKKKRPRWSAPEIKKLYDLRASGAEWKEVSKQLPGRTESSCRTYKHRGRIKPSDDERRTKVARLYERTDSFSRKSEIWQLIADDMDISAKDCEEIHWDMGQAEMILRASLPEDESK